MAEKEIADEMKSLKKTLNKKNLSDTKSVTGTTNGATKRIEKELWSVTAEKRRFEEVLTKVQDTILGGTRAQDVVEDMKRCSKVLAAVDANREMTLHEIDELEIRLSLVNAENQTTDKETKS